MRPPIPGSATRDVVRTSVMNTMNLSYVDMNLARDGSVMTHDQIREERFRQGFCTKCRGTPVRLFKISKSRFNPLWTSKEACTLESQSLNGTCLRCNPELDPKRKRRSNGRKMRPRTVAEISTVALAGDTTDNADNANTDTAREAMSRHSPPRTAARNGGLEDMCADGMGGQENVEQSIMHLNSSLKLHNRPLSPSLISPGASTPSSTWSATLMRQPTEDRSLSPPRPPLRTPPAPHPRIEYEYTFTQPLDARMATVSMPDIITSSRNDSTDAVALALGASKSDNISTNFVMKERAHEEANEEEDDNTDDEDNIEIMYARCRRMTAMRNLRQSSMRNLAAPPANTSPILNHLIRNANSPPRDIPFHPNPGDDAQHAMQQSSIHNLASQRILHVPPKSSDSEPPSTEEKAVTPLLRKVSTDTRNDDAAIVSELGSLMKDLSSQGPSSADFATDILVGAMKENPDSVAVQLFCLGTIWDLCKASDFYKSSIISTSAPDDILLSMKTHLKNAEIQERACGALWSLSVNQHNRIIVIRAGAPARILKSIVEHQSNESVIRTAVGCLRTLSPESEVRESMGALQGIKHVCEAMTSHQGVACIQRDGCAFLSNSAVDLDNQQVAMASDYEFQAIALAMGSHTSNASVMTGACFALKNYTYEERNIRTLSSVDGIASLLENASQYSHNSGCQRDASIVLERIQNCRAEDSALEDHVVTSLADSRRECNSDPNAMRNVLGIMNDYDWSAKITVEVLQCLVSLAHQNVQHRRQITGQVLLDVIARMAKMIGSAPVQINGCEFLEVIVRDAPNLQPVIINGGACKIMVDASRKHLLDVQVQVATTGVVKLLSLHFECWFELQKSDGKPIEEILLSHPDSSTIQQNGSDILTNFSAHAL